MLTLTPAQHDRLRSFLADQIIQAENERESLEDMMSEAIDRYEAKAKPKNFPWPGACSIHIPLVAIAQDSIKARMMNSLFGSERIINGVPLMEEEIPGAIDPVTGRQITWRTMAEWMEQYLQFETSPAGDIDLKAFVEDWLDEVLSFGTGVVKICWETITEQEVLEDGTTRALGVSYDNVRLIVIPRENFLFPSGYDSLTRIPWVSHRYSLRPSEIRTLADSDPTWISDNVKSFLTANVHPKSDKTDVDQDQIATLGLNEDSFYNTSEIWLYETWARVDVDGKGTELKLVITHTAPSDGPITVLRVIGWPYSSKRLPFVVGRYIKRRKRLDGMGIPERLASLDEGLSTSVCQTIDNVSIANTRFWKVDRNSEAAKQLDRIYPGAKVLVDNQTDVQPEQMGEIYPSAFEVGNLIRDYAERTIKLSDYNLGRESQALGEQSTATATLALLQESGQYFDSITRDFRYALNEVLQLWMDLIVQNKPIARVSKILGQRAEPFLLALTLPHGDLRSRIGLRIAFSSSAATRELARQEEQAKLGLLKEYYASLFQLTQTALEMPPLIPLVMAVAADAELRVKKLLEAYGDSYTSSTLPSLTTILPGVMSAQQQLLALQPPAPPQPEGAPRMANSDGGNRPAQEPQPDQAP